MSKFMEKRVNPIRPTKSYLISPTEEKDKAAFTPTDQVDAPIQKHVSAPVIKNFHKSQDYRKLKESLGRHLFEDDKFPASNKLLSDDGQGQVFHYFQRRHNANEIVWLRPHVRLTKVMKLA